MRDVISNFTESKNSSETSQTHNFNYIDETSFKTICGLRVKNPYSPLIGYLNINSLRNKIIDVREILTKFSPDYFVFAETKLH